MLDGCSGSHYIGGMNKPVTERITAAEAVTNFEGVLTRVQAEGLTYVVTKGKSEIARVEAIKKTLTLAELDAAFAAIPPLGEEEATLWEAELNALRADLPLPESPWES